MPLQHNIPDNPISSDGYSEEINSLLRELKLDVPVLSPAPGPDIRDMAKHLNMTQERLHSQILLEIEQNSTPKVEQQPQPQQELPQQLPPPAMTPLASCDLTERFDNTTPP